MINKVTLLGNTGKEPDVRRLENGKPVATFSVATTESYKDNNGEWQNLTEWHTVVCWNALAEYAEKNVKKGTLVYVEGKITHREYEKDGVKRYITEIVANTVKPLSKKEGSEPTQPAAATKEDKFEVNVTDSSATPKTQAYKVGAKWHDSRTGVTLTVTESTPDKITFNSTQKEGVFELSFQDWQDKIMPKYVFQIESNTSSGSDDLPF